MKSRLVASSSCFFSPLSAALVLLLTSTALAGPQVHRATGFRFNIPDEWNTVGKGDVLTASDGSGAASLSFIPMNVADLTAAMAAMDVQLAKSFTNVRNSKKQTLNINGMAVVLVEALAEAGGVPVDLFVGIYRSGGKTLVVVGAIQRSKLPAYAPVVNGILRSVKR